MSQPTLFGGAHQVLLEGATGIVTYHPGVATPADAARWFADLRDGVAWRHERRLMYQREVDVPRLVAGFRLDDPALPPALGEAADRVRGLAATSFNAVGLNYYRDQHDSVAPHNDRLGELVAGHPIALLSLGATRTMSIRAKAPPRGSLAIDLEPGSVLVMDYATQLHYLHGIPKQKAKTGGRISVAFRCRPAHRLQ
jgi:alkylated DNA repair dioxygenase AlkB